MKRVQVLPFRPFGRVTCNLGSLFALAGLCVLVQTAPAATLTHRYSFDANAGDSVGGAGGVLQGNAYITNGVLVLDGTNSSVRLPDDLFTNDDSVSFELWFTNGTITSPNAHLYSFSGINGTMSYLLDGQGIYVLGTSTNAVGLSAPAVAGTVHLVWTQDSASQTARLYVDGLLAAENTNFAPTPVSIGSTTNECIGGIGSISTNANFQGSMLEFRTYHGALSPLDVAVDDALGPDQIQLNPGALMDLHFSAPPPTGPGALFRLGVYADFANVTNVNISTQPDLVLSSDNTNVIVVSPDQRLQTIGLGVADITASYQGISKTLAITVGVPPDVALIHRYNFNEPTNDWIVHDSVGQADGRLFNTGSHSPTNGFFTGDGEMVLAGGYQFAGSSGGFATLPSGIISCLSEVTVEAWVTWTTPRNLSLTYGFGAWQRIFDFGSQLYGQGVSYLFLTPATDNSSFTTKPLLHSAITTNGNFSETPRLNWSYALPLNVTSFVAVAYSPVRGVMKMYLNGVPVDSGTATLPLSGINDTNNLLGKSQFATDAYFYGRYDEFRIYRGLLSDADVAADYSAGPNTVGVDFVLHDFVSGNSLAITWGTTATNWYLETTPVLGSLAVWTPIQDKPTLENGRYRLAVPITGNAAYFRLHAP